VAINDRLLERARSAALKLAEAEQNVQTARTEYHNIVRRIHLSGSSLREVAQALEISHQRVQQIVAGVGGTWWQRMWRTRKMSGNLNCTCCNRSEQEVAKLIAGPKVFICDLCIGLAEQSFSSKPVAAARNMFVPAKDETRLRCSFCSKRSSPDRSLMIGPANICSDCLRICRQILVDVR
jgi:hypothetical protein